MSPERIQAPTFPIAGSQLPWFGPRCIWGNSHRNSRERRDRRMTRSRIEQHPDEYRDDLNPDYEAGENHGPPRYETRTAYDVKELHGRLRDLRDDLLKQIPVLVEG